MMHRRRYPHRLPLSTQRGVSLIELMVASVIGIILSIGVVQLFQKNKQAWRLQESQNIVNENARFAINQMQYHLRLAGHWSGIGTEGVTAHSSATSKTITNDCGTNWLVETLGFEGFEGDANSPLDCIPNSNYVDNSDIIVTRFASPTRFEKGDVETSPALFVRTAIGRRGVIFQGDQLSSLSADLEPSITVGGDIRSYYRYPNHPLEVAVYFVRPCSDTGANNRCGDAGDDDTPTLVRVVLNATGDTLVEEDLVAGVEQMQVSYGVDYNGDLNADRYDTATNVTTAGAWASVVSARITLLVREETRDTTFTDAATIEVGDTAAGGGIDYTIPADDRQFRRRVYTTLVQIRNHTRA